MILYVIQFIVQKYKGHPRTVFIRTAIVSHARHHTVSVHSTVMSDCARVFIPFQSLRCGHEQSRVTTTTVHRRADDGVWGGRGVGRGRGGVVYPSRVEFRSSFLQRATEGAQNVAGGSATLPRALQPYTV